MLPCNQCDYLGASEKGLKQHVRRKHKKAEATPVSPEALRSTEKSSRSLIGSPLPHQNREENCQNCDGPFSPEHQCGDVEEVEDDAGDSDSEEEESYNEDFEPPVVRLLRTMSSLRNDDKKRAALDMLLQLD